MTRCQFAVQRIDWASERMKMTQDCGCVGVCKQLLRYFAIFESRCGVESFVCRSQCVRPQVGGDGFWPSRFGMQKNRGCLVLKVPDPFLSDPVLPVGVDSAVADALATGRDVIDELVVGKATIVCMVMLDRHASCLAVSLKGFLSL